MPTFCNTQAGTRFAGRMGVRAYREFCRPWLAAQRDAIGSRLYIGVDQKVQGYIPFRSVTIQETQQGEARGQGRRVVLTTFDVGRLTYMEARQSTSFSSQ